MKKINSNIGAAHRLCNNFWTSQLPKLQVSAFYFLEAMSNLIFGRLPLSFDKNGHGSFHQRSICMFFFTKNELQKWLCTILIQSYTELFSHVQIFPKFTEREESLNWGAVWAHFLTLIRQDLANPWRSGWLAWTLSAEWGKFQELRMVSVPLLPSIAKLRMVSVGQFHRQAFQHTHMSFEKGRWQSIWRSLNIRKTMIALSSQSKIQRYTFRAQLNPDR